jgi:putative salt-induced outer membrane protein YdiY
MHPIRAALAAAALLTAAVAQDRITLTNGDVLTGTIKTMADGKVTITSPLLGDVTVPMTSISDLATKEMVELRTVNGETFKRRITGMESGKLRLEGDVPSLVTESVTHINPPPEEEPKWTGSVLITGSLSDGNTERRSVGATAEASRRTKWDRTTADASWDYADDKATGDWVLSQRRAGAGLKYDYFLTKRMYTYVMTRVLSDTFADLALRFTGGAGIGTTVIENDTTTLLTEVGLSYVSEDYRSGLPTHDYLAARVAYKFSHIFNERTKLLHGVEAYPSVSDADDIYLQMKTEVITKLGGSMVGSLSWIMDYDNTPSPGFERADQRFLLSIGWSF